MCYLLFVHFFVVVVVVEIKTDTTTHPVRVQIVIQNLRKVLHRKIRIVIRALLPRQNVVVKKAKTDINLRDLRSKPFCRLFYIILRMLVVIPNVPLFLINFHLMLIGNLINSEFHIKILIFYF